MANATTSVEAKEEEVAKASDVLNAVKDEAKVVSMRKCSRIPEPSYSFTCARRRIYRKSVFSPKESDSTGNCSQDTTSVSSGQPTDDSGICMDNSMENSVPLLVSCSSGMTGIGQAEQESLRALQQAVAEMEADLDLIDTDGDTVVESNGPVSSKELEKEVESAVIQKVNQLLPESLSPLQEMLVAPVGQMVQENLKEHLSNGGVVHNKEVDAIKVKLYEQLQELANETQEQKDSKHLEIETNPVSESENQRYVRENFDKISSVLFPTTSMMTTKEQTNEDDLQSTSMDNIDDKVLTSNPVTVDAKLQDPQELQELESGEKPMPVEDIMPRDVPPLISVPVEELTKGIPEEQERTELKIETNPEQFENIFHIRPTPRMMTMNDETMKEPQDRTLSNPLDDIKDKEKPQELESTEKTKPVEDIKPQDVPPLISVPVTEVAMGTPEEHFEKIALILLATAPMLTTDEPTMKEQQNITMSEPLEDIKDKEKPQELESTEKPVPVEEIIEQVPEQAAIDVPNSMSVPVEAMLEEPHDQALGPTSQHEDVQPVEDIIEKPQKGHEEVLPVMCQPGKESADKAAEDTIPQDPQEKQILAVTSEAAAEAEELVAIQGEDLEQPGKESNDKPEEDTIPQEVPEEIAVEVKPSQSTPEEDIRLNQEPQEPQEPQIVQVTSQAASEGEEIVNVQEILAKEEKPAVDRTAEENNEQPAQLLDHFHGAYEEISDRTVEMHEEPNDEVSQTTLVEDAEELQQHEQYDDPLQEGFPQTELHQELIEVIQASTSRTIAGQQPSTTEMLEEFMQSLDDEQKGDQIQKLVEEIKKLHNEHPDETLEEMVSCLQEKQHVEEEKLVSTTSQQVESDNRSYSPLLGMAGLRSLEGQMPDGILRHIMHRDADLIEVVPDELEENTTPRSSLELLEAPAEQEENLVDEETDQPRSKKLNRFRQLVNHLRSYSKPMDYVPLALVGTAFLFLIFFRKF